MQALDGVRVLVVEIDAASAKLFALLLRAESVDTATLLASAVGDEGAVQMRTAERSVEFPCQLKQAVPSKGVYGVNSAS